MAAMLLLLLGAPQDPGDISPRVRDFIARRCVDCHGPRMQKAGMRFDVLSPRITNDTAALMWQDILDILNTGEMPPPEVPRPPDAELADILELLTRDLMAARAKLADSGGRTVLRRLNRREYRLAVESLLGVPVETDLLPDDDRVDGFDTVAAAQGFSSLQLDRYLALGRRALDRALAQERTDKTPPSRVEPETRALEDLQKKHLPKIEREIERLAANANKNPAAQKRLEPLLAEKARIDACLADPRVKTGMFMPLGDQLRQLEVKFGNRPAPGRYAIRIRCGVAAEKAVDPLYLEIRKGERLSSLSEEPLYVQVLGTAASPQTIEVEVSLDSLGSKVFWIERRGSRPNLRGKDVPPDPLPPVWIDWVEKEGPLDEAVVPEARKRLLAGGDVRETIRAFAFEAYRRREPSPEQLDRLVAVHREARAAGASETDALKEALAVVLASPSFLYLSEPGDARRPLTARELAVRLALFLWSAPPDAELYRLAESGRLLQPGVLAGQVDRLLASPRAEIFFQSFVDQWLGLEALDRLEVPGEVSPDFDGLLRHAMRQEPVRFFETLVKEDLSLAHLVDSDFVVVDSLLARHYGLPGVTGAAFRKVPLPRGSVRGGLLGMAGVHALGSNGERTLPVDRGAFVLRKILHRPPPPPPPNVPMLNEEAVGGTSLREVLTAHQNKPQCVSCHRRIDPLGFGLENFDAVGRWRSAEQGRPLDVSGVMPDGRRSFRTYEELKGHLRADADRTVRGLAEALAVYALGRTAGFTDGAWLDEAAARSGRGARSLIRAIVTSEAFRSR